MSFGIYEMNSPSHDTPAMEDKPAGVDAFADALADAIATAAKAAVVPVSDSKSEEAPVPRPSSPASAKAHRRQVSEKAQGKRRGECWIFMK